MVLTYITIKTVSELKKFTVAIGVVRFSCLKKNIKVRISSCCVIFDNAALEE